MDIDLVEVNTSVYEYSFTGVQNFIYKLMSKSILYVNIQTKPDDDNDENTIYEYQTLKEKE